MKINLASNYGPSVPINEQELFMGFDRMTDDEIIYVMENSPYPELMGFALGKWLKKKTQRVGKFFKKVGKQFKAMPTWAKVATIATGPAGALGLVGRTAVQPYISAKKKMDAQKRNKAKIAAAQAAEKKKLEDLTVQRQKLLAETKARAAANKALAVKQAQQQAAIAANQAQLEKEPEKSGLGALLPLAGIGTALAFLL